MSWGDLDDGSWREGSRKLQHRQAVAQTTFSFAASSQRFKTSLTSGGGGGGGGGGGERGGVPRPKKGVSFSTATTNVVEVREREAGTEEDEEGNEDGDEAAAAVAAATPEEREQEELLREFSLRSASKKRGTLGSASGQGALYGLPELPQGGPRREKDWVRVSRTVARAMGQSWGCLPKPQDLAEAEAEATRIIRCASRCRSSPRT